MDPATGHGAPTGRGRHPRTRRPRLRIPTTSPVPCSTGRSTGCSRGERVAWDDIDRGIALMTRRRGTSFVARRAQEVAERCLWHLGRLREAIAFDEAEYRRLADRGQVGPAAAARPVAVRAAPDERRLGSPPAATRRSAWTSSSRARRCGASGRSPRGRGSSPGRATSTRRARSPPTRWRRQEAAGDRWEATIFCALLGFVELSVPDPRAALALPGAGARARRRDGDRPAHPVPLPGRPRRGRRPGRRPRPGRAGPARSASKSRPSGCRCPGSARWPRAAAGSLTAARGDLERAVAVVRPRRSRCSTRRCRCRSSGPGHRSPAGRSTAGPATVGRPARTSGAALAVFETLGAPRLDERGRPRSSGGSAAGPPAARHLTASERHGRGAGRDRSTRTARSPPSSSSRSGPWRASCRRPTASSTFAREVSLRPALAARPRPGRLIVAGVAGAKSRGFTDAGGAPTA